MAHIIIRINNNDKGVIVKLYTADILVAFQIRCSFFFKALCVTSNRRANVVTFSIYLHVHLKIYQI